MSHITIDIPKVDPACEYAEIAWGVKEPGNKIELLQIPRPKCKDHEVKFRIDYSGICHTDVHLGNNDLGGATFPMVPGHELAGTVVEVGAKVTKHKVGDLVGVGCIVESCQNCCNCKDQN